MDATGGLIALAVVLVVALLGWWSYRQYRRKARIAQAKSRAALNRLLAEADALQQAHRQDPEDPADPPR